MFKTVMTLGCAFAVAGTFVAAQGTSPATPAQAPTPASPAQAARPASPQVKASTQVGGQWVKGERGESYQGGKWIDITYGAPVKRGRTTLWGSGADYAKTLLGGAPVWRAGANVSTRLKTDVPLEIGGKTVPAGEYSLFIEPKSATEWTLIVSSWGAKATGGDKTPDTLWGGYNYTPDKDVARVAMQVDKLPMAIDQLAWNFADVTATGGKIVLLWDTVAASAPFTVSK